MNCGYCAFNSQVQDEEGRYYEICCFSKADEFLTPVDFFHECKTENEAFEASREKARDDCWECKHQAVEDDESPCLKCKVLIATNERSKWEWENDN